MKKEKTEAALIYLRIAEKKEKYPFFYNGSWNSIIAFFSQCKINEKYVILNSATVARVV